MKTRQTGPNISRIQLVLVLVLCMLLLTISTASANGDQLSAPQNLHASAKTSSSITMAWDSVSGASYYRFYQSGVFVCNVYTTSYTSSGLESNTVYGFKVCAVDSSGDLGAYSNNIYVRTQREKLYAPQNLRSTAKTENSITMAWNGVTGANYYRFYKAGVFLTNVYGTSFTADGLSADTVYGFKVAAVAGDEGLGDYSGHVYVRTQQTKLSLPQNLRSTDKTASSITMTWNSVEGASYYRFYKAGKFLTNVYGTSYTATSLASNTVYGFKVAAVASGGGLGDYSGNVYVRTQPVKLPAPQSFHVTAKTTNSITMAWSSVTGASYYRFYRSGVFVCNVYSTSYTSAGLSPNTVYGFKVAAVSSTNGIGDYSNNVYVRSQNDQLLAPGKLHSTEKTINSITMEWGSVSGASYYRFYKDGKFYTNVYGTSYTVNELSVDTVYGFKVAAVDIDGKLGKYSGNVYVRTQKLTAPQNPRAVATTDTSITLKWDSVVGADYYIVYEYKLGDYGDGLVYGYHTTIGQTNSTSLTCTGFMQNTYHTLFVVAFSKTNRRSPESNYCTAYTISSSPTKLFATNTTDKSIKLQWRVVYGASYYRLYMDDMFLENVYENNYTVNGLSYNTAYNFKVVDVNESGIAGKCSNTLSVTTKYPPLIAPPNFGAIAKTSGSITVSWDSYPGVEYYRFYQNGIYIEKVYGLSYTSTNLVPDRVYCFKAAAVDKNGKLGPYTTNIYVRTRPIPLTAPQNLHTTTVTTNSIRIAWDYTTGIDHYIVYQNGVFVRKVYGAYCTCTGLTPDTAYEFKVAAANSAGAAGPFSEPLLTRTEAQLATPQNLRAVAVTSDAITMSWNDVAGASYYRIYLNGIFECRVYGTAYTASGLLSDATYGFKVVAVSASGSLGLYSGNVFVRTQE